MARDPYRILQLAHHAEPEVIEAAYKRLALKYHPDQNLSANATAHMQDINWAYHILKDPTKRARYDQGVRPKAPPKPKPPPAQPKPPPPKPPPAQPKPPPPKPPPARPKPKPPPKKPQTRSKPTKTEKTTQKTWAKIILIAFAGLLLIVVPDWITTANSNRKEATRKAQLILSATFVPLPTQTPTVLSQPIETVRIINDPAVLYNDDRYPVLSLPYGLICNKLGQDTWEPGIEVYEIECPELNVKGWVWATFTR